ncbi:AsmA family protein, partial [Ferruginibacter sp.]|uniref:AsmA family protein n=1 Tax=Ferruginibacter sp. TaxID=1940288 RepID=UPI0019A7A8C2
MIKKLLKIVLISLLVLTGVAFAIPYLFKSQLTAKVKKEINAKLNARVDFKEVNISFFRHFPKVAVGLDDFYITGNGVFAADTLLAAKQIDAAVNIMSVIKGSNITIYSVFVESPRVHAIVSKDSLVNWDIVKPDTTAQITGAEKVFKMELQRYEINNAYISYKDEPSVISAEIFNLNHSGSGDFTADLFTLKTIPTAENVNVTYGGIAYLSNAKAAVAADIQ